MSVSSRQSFHVKTETLMYPHWPTKYQGKAAFLLGQSLGNVRTNPAIVISSSNLTCFLDGFWFDSELAPKTCRHLCKTLASRI